MEQLKVFIENLPVPDHWSIKWAPVAIALAARFVAIVSLVWSSKQFRKSSRPFVWSMNFASLDDQKKIINHPETAITQVSNSPAQINRITYEFYYMENGNRSELHSYNDKSKVVFPSEKSQYTYTVPGFNKLIEGLPANVKLKKYIRIEYSDLSGNEHYYYESRSYYDFNEKVWRIEFEDAY